MSLKHIGRVNATNRKCIVVFREIYDEKGNVVEQNQCLVVETETLPDAEHDAIVNLIESQSAQSNPNIYDVFARIMLANGVSVLRWLQQTNRLRKYPTSAITMTPDNKTSLPLDTLNTIVRMQKSGASVDAINAALTNKSTTTVTEAPVTPTVAEQSKPALVVSQTTASPGVLDDTALGKMKLKQAEFYDQQATDLRTEAYALDPMLNPIETTATEIEPVAETRKPKARASKKVAEAKE
jgi:hypothetical protein